MDGIIKERLSSIELDSNVKVLFAAESGSRAWGFPSPDSDYDARFIYVHPKDYYLSIDDQRDVIELPVDEVLDINGWDIRKALKLFAKSNAPLFEWLQSPIVYQSDERFHKALVELMPQYFNPRAMFHHYYSMAKSVTEGAELAGSEIKLKKYFYGLRTLLSCKWILERNEVPPMEFGKLRVLLDEDAKEVVDELLELKSKGDEALTVKPMWQVHLWITNQRAKFQNERPDEKTISTDRTPLNKLFRQYLK
jgi:predicted nucleotidyltransferase